MRGSLLLVCLAMAACDVPQAQTDQITCQDLCRCIGGLPAQETACEAECVAALAPVPEACTSCVEDHLDACSTMITDCLPTCQPPQTPREGAPE